jgi:hypothetical protein
MKFKSSAGNTAAPKPSTLSPFPPPLKAAPARDSGCDERASRKSSLAGMGTSNVICSACKFQIVNNIGWFKLFKQIQGCFMPIHILFDALNTTMTVVH